jgi:hypothetical protein
VNKEAKELLQKSILGKKEEIIVDNKFNHKNSTNYEEMGLDEYEQILKDNQETDTMNKDHLWMSHDSSLL